MQRDSDRHGPRKDDEMVRELRGTLQGNRPSRAEEWRDPEPPADDDPSPWLGDLSHARQPDSPQVGDVSDPREHDDLAPQRGDLSHAGQSGSLADDDLAPRVSQVREPDSRGAE